MASKLNSVANELERAVFDVVYRSRKQKVLRLCAWTLLQMKYFVAGLFYIWPVYLIILAMMVLPLTSDYVFYLLVFLPALILWLGVQLNAARAEYGRVVKGHILKKGFIRKLLFESC